MFNPLTPGQYATAIGRAARDAARAERPLDEFGRGQLMSAYSGSRHLAVELDCFAQELQAFADAAAEAIARAALAVPDDEFLRTIERALRARPDAISVGMHLSDLLLRLRGEQTGILAELRAELRRLLRSLCDREVALLAEAIEGGSSR